MKPIVAAVLMGGVSFLRVNATEAVPRPGPITLGRGSSQPLIRSQLGPPGQVAHYRLQAAATPRDSTVTKVSVGLGAVERQAGADYQWLVLEATKANGKSFRLWLLTAGYPPESAQAAENSIARYILQEGAAKAAEFRHRLTGRAVLPQLGGWRYLLPRPSLADNESGNSNPFPRQIHCLGLSYTLELVEGATPALPPNDARIIELQPDVLIGTASNTRQKDETRRYDNSDYEYMRLSRSDYFEMSQAGLNCLKVDAEQLAWVEDLPAFYWGLGANELPYPECLYRSSYLGPTLFLDEPAVGTRDNVLRPRLAKDATFRKTISPQVALDAFQDYFQRELKSGASTSLFNGIKARDDIDPGDLAFTQQNLFSWETMVESAVFELSQDPLVPAAMVFEPPGRVGTLRTLPELDMTYGCQLPVNDPHNLTAIIYGFLRGAARLTNKSWGTSIYGAVDRADSFWWLTHAYDLGATRFFFWDNAKLACVPYGECLTLARNLRAHVDSYPTRDLQQLNRAAEVAILLPPGYNLGHVQMGKGSLWGLPELNLERVNQNGVKYRTVMSNFFTEIERCLRLGVAFDLLWDPSELQSTSRSQTFKVLAGSGYREIVHVREDGRVEVDTHGKVSLLKSARVPFRPQGVPPSLALDLSATKGQAPLQVVARASVLERSVPVFYTLGADPKGVYRNEMVAWELYGPRDEDYRFLTPDLKPKVSSEGNRTGMTITFSLRHPGHYRLRAATVDLAGRTTVVWTPITVTE